MAGNFPDRTVSESHYRIATFYGQSSDDGREVNASQDIDTFHITGGIGAFGPGRVNYHFGWEGLSSSIDAACSSSALSIQLAALRSRECGMALAGGGNLMTASDLFAGLSRGKFLSPTGPCKTWDASADGYCRADAVATVFLKRVEDAIRDNDNILGVIDAVTTNHSARAISITHPDTETQQKLYKEVLRTSGIKPNKVDFVEMHGTGTQAGDCAEANSVTEVFGNARDSHWPLVVGTVKPNLGRGEAASEVASVMKALMMMLKSTIPRHIGIKSGINSKLSFASSNSIVIPLENMPFVPDPKGDGRQRVLVNNFNATGGNTSLVLEDFPAKERGQAEDPRKFHVVSVSATTQNSFKANLKRLADYLIATSQIDLADLSYTTTTRRMHHAYRFTRAVSSTRELIREIKRQQNMAGGLLRVRKPADVFSTFTGQASQYAGMRSQLFHTSKVFGEHMCSSNAIWLSFGFPSFIEVIVLPNLGNGEYNTIQYQLALVALQLALANVWTS